MKILRDVLKRSFQLPDEFVMMCVFMKRVDEESDKVVVVLQRRLQQQHVCEEAVPGQSSR